MKIMNSNEIKDYAIKNNKFNSLNFIITNVNGKSWGGKFLDAHSNIVIIPEISDDSILLSEIDKLGCFTFVPIK